MVEDQPAVPGQDGRSSTADFEQLPWRYWRRQPVVRVEQTGVMQFSALHGHRAVRNPDTFMIEIDYPRFGLAGCFLGVSAVEKGPMEDGHLHFAGMVGNGDGEKAGIFVVH